MERVAIFIDNAYFKIVQQQEAIPVDYEKFCDEIIDSTDQSSRFRTYVYDCPPYQSNPPTAEEMKRKSGFDAFKYNIIRLSRFEVRTGRLQIQRDEKGNILKKADGTPILRQKGVDMALGIDAALLAATKQVQRIILVAGDSDFVPAILAAKEEGVIVTLFFYPKGIVHDSLFEACDERFPITRELLQKSERKTREKNKIGHK